MDTQEIEEKIPYVENDEKAYELLWGNITYPVIRLPRVTLHEIYVNCKPVWANAYMNPSRNPIHVYNGKEQQYTLRDFDIMPINRANCIANPEEYDRDIEVTPLFIRAHDGSTICENYPTPLLQLFIEHSISVGEYLSNPGINIKPVKKE